MKINFGAKDLPGAVDPGSLISPDIPKGYQTVCGWWATQERQALDLLDSPICTFVTDCEALSEIADLRGIDTHYVVSPPPLQGLGFAYVRAYPERLLFEFYPVLA